jgi:hypothetical protein
MGFRGVQRDHKSIKAAGLQSGSYEPDCRLVFVFWGCFVISFPVSYARRKKSIDFAYKPNKQKRQPASRVSGVRMPFCIPAFGHLRRFSKMRRFLVSTQKMRRFASIHKFRWFVSKLTGFFHTLY